MNKLVPALALALAALFAGCAGAHPVHATFAEAVWNPKTRSVEVALRVRGLDLETALAKACGSPVDLDKTENVDGMISEYLCKTFTVAMPDGSTLMPKWSTKDVGLRNTWLYFEFPLGESVLPTECQVTNTIFFDDLEGQQNVIEYREGLKKRILAFQGDTRQMALGLEG